jgi:predicted amidophosphoribosyltransferase
LVTRNSTAPLARSDYHNLCNAYKVVRPELVRGARIILVDDVVTTGATLEVAAAALKSASAKRVEAAVFAQA